MGVRVSRLHLEKLVCPFLCLSIALRVHQKASESVYYAIVTRRQILNGLELEQPIVERHCFTEQVLFTGEAERVDLF